MSSSVPSARPPADFAPDLRRDVAVLLRRAREDVGWSRDRLAAETGLAAESLRAWESGRRSPTLRSVELVLDVLGLRAVVDVRPVHAELDAGLDRLQGRDVGARLDDVRSALPAVLAPFLAGGLDPVVDGATAALLHGLPVADPRAHLSVDATALAKWRPPEQAAAVDAAAVRAGQPAPRDPDGRWEALWWALVLGRARPVVRGIAPQPGATAPAEPWDDRERLRVQDVWSPVTLDGPAEVVVRVLDEPARTVPLAVPAVRPGDLRAVPALVGLPAALQAVAAWERAEVVVRVRALPDLATDPVHGPAARRALQRLLAPRTGVSGQAR